MAYRPIHESVVSAIDNAHVGIEMDILANLLKQTKIPTGHDAIIAAWERKSVEMGWDGDYLGVRASLLEQKRAATVPDARKSRPGSLAAEWGSR